MFEEILINYLYFISETSNWNLHNLTHIEFVIASALLQGQELFHVIYFFTIFSTATNDFLIVSLTLIKDKITYHGLPQVRILKIRLVHMPHPYP